MHLLGYGVDPGNSPSCATSLEASHRGPQRSQPADRLRRLNELGVTITMKEIEDEAGGEGAGRQASHYRGCCCERGYVGALDQAGVSTKYLGQERAAYFDKGALTAHQASPEMVLQSGGLPWCSPTRSQLRHPKRRAQLERIVKDLKDLGLVGLEVIHSDHDAALVEKYTKLADRFGLLKTGGSDFHGTNKKDIATLGTANGRRIPRRQFFDALIDRALSVGRALPATNFEKAAGNARPYSTPWTRSPNNSTCRR